LVFKIAPTGLEQIPIRYRIDMHHLDFVENHKEAPSAGVLKTRHRPAGVVGVDGQSR
jgi:hypothetical protein